MKFAIVNGDRMEAESGLLGQCPCCGSPMLAKCGDIRLKHWAHRGKRNCDPWWENETEWHRGWKAHFPKQWQEVIQRADSGEKHIADVKTDQGYVIEFQHSNIKSDECGAREAFYKKMIWIVDGNRRLRDKDKLMDALRSSKTIDGREDLREAPGGFRCPLLRDWTGRMAPVFFDLGEETLWGILPENDDRNTYVINVGREEMVSSFLPGAKIGFDLLLKSFKDKIASHEWYLRKMAERRGDPLLALRNANFSSRRRS